MDKWKVFVTALRLFKYDYMAMWGFVQRPRGRTIPKTATYFVPVNKVKRNKAA